MDNVQMGFLFPLLRDKIQYWKTIDGLALPRRVRAKSSETDIPLHLRNYIELCILRSRRLLASSDELRREAWDTRKIDHDTFQLGIKNPTFVEESEDDLLHSLSRARQIEVVWSDLTSEFLDSRDYPHWQNGKANYGRWRFYKECCRSRRVTGELCRSNLDWDWDLSISLKRLFRFDGLKKALNPETAMQAEILQTASGVNEGTSDVFILKKGSGVQDKVRIWYEDEFGEVKHKTFVAIEDIASAHGP